MDFSIIPHQVGALLAEYGHGGQSAKPDDVNTVTEGRILTSLPLRVEVNNISENGRFYPNSLDC